MKVSPKRLEYGKNARKKLLAGVTKLADAVSVTLGARGRYVIFESPIWQKPQITNDGVTIAREMRLKDPFEDMGCQIVKQASFRTNDLAGDGTTTAVVLAHALVEAAFDGEEGMNPVAVKYALTELVQQVIDEAARHRHLVKSAEDLVHIATISCRDPKLGKLVGELVYELGENSAISFEEGVGSGVEAIQQKGIKWDHGITHGTLKNNRHENDFDNEEARVLIVNGKINSLTDFGALAQYFVEGKMVRHPQTGKEMMDIEKVNVPRLVIIAEHMHASVLQFMFNNSVGRGGPLDWVWVKPPSFGSRREAILEDIAAATGATIADKEKGNYVRNFKLDDLGTVKSAYSDREHTVLVPLSEEVVADRVEYIKNVREESKSEVEIKQYDERIAALEGGLATIRYSAATDVEKRELKYRLDDAVFAAKATLESGYVEGGGVALLKAVNSIVEPEGEDAKIAYKILKNACEKPCRLILRNAGVEDVDDVLVEILKTGKGVDVNTLEHTNLVKAGVIDPFKVLKLTLQNAVSAAGTLITTECSITNEPEEEETKK